MLQDYLFLLLFEKLSKLRIYSAQQLAAAIEQCAELETVLEWLINHTA